MESLAQSRCRGFCMDNGFRTLRRPAQCHKFAVKAYKDDSFTAASGKPGQLQGGLITFKTPGSPALPPAPLGSQGSASDLTQKALPAASSATSAASSSNSSPAPAHSAPTGPIPLLLTPPQVYEQMAAAGAAKTQLPLSKLVLLSILAGIYISFGGLLMLSVGTCCPGLAQSNPGLQRLVQGVVGVPFGLILVTLCGAELFNGNIAFMTAAFWEKKATLGQLLKNWVVSFLGNFVGAILIVKLVALSGLVIAAPSAVAVSGAKTSLPFVQSLARGIIGNWLVCIAVWSATAAGSLPGKVVGVLLSSFVAMGFEHSVANMFVIPLGIAAGADFTLGHFLSSNLLPVTLGNIIGGGLCLATPYAFAYGRKHAATA